MPWWCWGAWPSGVRVRRPPGPGGQTSLPGGGAGHPGSGLQHPPPAHPDEDDRRTGDCPSGHAGVEVTAEGLLCKASDGSQVLIPGQTVICAVGQRANRADARPCTPPLPSSGRWATASARRILPKRCMRGITLHWIFDCAFVHLPSRRLFEDRLRPCKSLPPRCGICLAAGFWVFCQESNRVPQSKAVRIYEFWLAYFVLQLFLSHYYGRFQLPHFLILTGNEAIPERFITRTHLLPGTSSDYIGLP